MASRKCKNTNGMSAPFKIYYEIISDKIFINSEVIYILRLFLSDLHYIDISTLGVPSKSAEKTKKVYPLNLT